MNKIGRLENEPTCKLSVNECIFRVFVLIKYIKVWNKRVYEPLSK